MKWIKASEILPDLYPVNNSGGLHYKLDGVKVDGFFLHKRCFEYFDNTIAGYRTVEFEEFARVEWLDESPAPLDDTFTFECKDPNCKHCAYDDEEALTPVSQPNGDKVAKEALIEKPVGDFIFEQNTPHIMLWNGAHYHYSDVCTLLKKYRQPEIGALMNKIDDLQRELNIETGAHEMTGKDFEALRDINAALKNRVEELEANGWKSVNDELPECLETVWISNGKGWTTLGCRSDLYDDGEGGFAWCWSALIGGNVYEEDGKIIAESEEDDFDVKFWHKVPTPISNH